MTRVFARAVFLCVLTASVCAAAEPAASDAEKKLAAHSLYQSAEEALGQGEYAEARHALKVLIERYPSSAEALRGQRMLEAIPGADLPPPPAADAPYVPPMASTTPEDALSRLRAAIDGGHDGQALGDAYDYLRRYPNRPDRYEVGLAIAALHLRRGEPERALKFLLPLARAPGRDPRLRTRAIHLLGGALTALGRDSDVLKAVPAADPGSTSDRWLALAQIWRAAAMDKMGHKDEAGELYRAFAASGQESPTRAYALAAIAADWDRQGKPDRARDALARASAEASRWRLGDLRDALALASANELTRAKRLDDAAAAYLDFTRDFPKSPLIAQAYYERGLALKRLGRPNEAVKSFEALLDRAPDSAYAADAHLQLGQLDTELGLTQEALTHYRKMGRASEAKDADREALLLMAQVHYNAKRWTDAIPLYRRYLKGAPEDSKTKEVQGLLLSSLWQADREDPELIDLAAKLPDHPLVASIRWQLASNAYKRKDWAAAEDLFRQQIEKDPHSPRTAEARFYRAEALRELGKTADAADAYRRFLSAHPKDPRARAAAMDLGALLYGSGDAAGAAAAYARVTGDDDEAADAAYNRALALSKSGKDPAASWEAFAARFPKHAKAPSAWWNAARLREDKFDNPGAAKDYEKASSGPERVKSLYALGRLREKLKQTAAAKSAYEKLKDATPKEDPARLSGLLRLGLMLELEDKPKDAAPLYAEVVKRSETGSPNFETARKRLEALTQDKSLIGK
ncbi:MAG: tetratricopeptide repeat protein [Elusimicrobiota bacterium]